MLRETLELVPFGKLLFSSDAYGLAELYLLGALLFRALADQGARRLVDHGDLTRTTPTQSGRWSVRENARRAYAL